MADQNAGSFGETSSAVQCTDPPSSKGFEPSNRASRLMVFSLKKKSKR
jgi:hypothetical protein